VRRDGQHGFIYDGTHDEAACAVLLNWIESRRTLASRGGTIRALATSAFDALRGDGPLPVKRSSAEQSNTSLFYGERLILKLFRRLQPGPNPDFEIGLFLTEGSRFDRVPQLAGALEYERGEGPPATLAILQEMVPNQGDGWAWTLEALGRYYEERASAQEPIPESELEPLSLLDRAGRERSPLAREAIGFYLDSAATLGRRTAEMHLALAGEDSDPAFAPEPITAKETGELLDQLRAHAAGALDLLKSSIARLPDDLLEKAGLLLSQRSRIFARFRDLPEAELARGKTRIHGDYHLGQVLVSGADYDIIDFEGEPARTLEERRAKHSPLKDVAGMLRSFSYAAYAALFAHVARRPDELNRLEPWADLWINGVSAAFLRAYLDTARDAPYLPPPAGLQQLLEAYLLDKALYELRYEINNRPDWVRIPLDGILPLIQRS
jgi:maltose alpha-D-glucosyltransferase/alpha-amylase